MKKHRKISKSFISFLLVSIIIWFVIAMSKDYVSTISYEVEYENIPQNKLLQKAPKKYIDVVVKSTGFQLVRSKFNTKKLSLNASNLIKKNTNTYYFLTRNQKSNIQNQLFTNVVLQEILQDTLYLNLGSLALKKVPLIANLDVDFHVGYDFSKTIEIAPDSVTISGPENKIDSITALQLAKLTLDDVKNDFEVQVKINKNNLPNSVLINTENITLKGAVEKYTEGKFMLPFEVANLPEEIELTTLTKEIEVVFVVGLTNFNRITANDFKIVCDFSLSQENNLNYLIPKVVKKPAFVKSLKIHPNKIDFLIQK